ncbi:DNA methylase N-4 [Caulobacter vibrioides]|uniref:site-specific DNA-methyltransferase (adenine-specific) n=1 Tax=Caulobacter vibrioides TaxID=155892 RepID=A0A290MQ78_CAUVI|nr:DNA methyltransferase [Caulobacter vibrioides]ATC34150.1 DNA methylase N-4 [Caulobacter vibrioides]
MTIAVRDYDAFLAAKVPPAPRCGFEIGDEVINPLLKPHQRAIVRWAVWRGRAAIFAAFGLGKSVMQLEIARIMRDLVGGRALIVMPLGVRQEFRKDAAMLGIDVTFIRRIEEATDPRGIYLTNYETVRDGKLDPNHFSVACLDEASCLRGFGGSKTFREFMRLFDRVAYRFVGTATPSPNDHIELLAYSAFLDVMDVGQAKTRFFKRDSENADNLTLHPHKEQEFWLWVASWALFVQRPSDLGFSDEGYALPELKVIYHEVPVDHRAAGVDKSGQHRLFQDDAQGIVGASKVKRDTLEARVLKMCEILRADPDERYILWHDLEAERAAIEAAVPQCVSVYGAQDPDAREDAIVHFSDGWFPYLAAKPVIAGSGCNFQRHCHKAVFLGIGFKFNDFIQAIHRIQRFLQQHPVEIHVIYAESERAVLRNLQEKWAQHEEMAATMSAIIRNYGLSNADMAGVLTRAMGVKDRIVVEGEGYRLVNDDTVRETRRMADSSVDLIVTSIPFSTQYEYSPNYADFGHTDDNEHFWQQMDYLVPELLRVLQPGRVAAIHVKDRIVPGGMTGLGFQTVYPFADDCRVAFRRHGFAYLGEKTNLTDVVRENNQTYRLGWSEQCKDGSRMGAGLPEKVLLFRKPPSDRSNGYADLPVAKDKDSYTRARWQLDAHHLMRSAGDRLVAPEEWAKFEDADQVYRLWKGFNLQRLYDFEHHVQIGEALTAVGRLPPTFMLLPPHSWHDDVWTDVAQMLSLNTVQAQKGAEKHLCPLPFDIVDRLITQFSMPGEMVFDPFGGLMTVPYRAIKLGRRGCANELNPAYFLDGVKHVEAMAREMATPTLFDLIGERPAPATEAA